MQSPLRTLQYLRKMTDTLTLFLQQCRNDVDQALIQLLTSPNKQLEPLETLYTAMRYSTLNGGKRIRPALVVAGARAITSASNQDLAKVGASIECIHSYSLIHDDLPAMDDDDLRRGQPTCHVQFNDATAILAGDALQALAFEQLTSLAAPPEVQIKLINLLSKAAGSKGMVGGQHIDLFATGGTLTLDELNTMHSLKTGALISASVISGGIIGGATDKQTQALSEYATHIGLAFQIKDDLLDVESPSETLGKTQGADAAKGKVTYPMLVGIEQARSMMNNTLENALQSIKGLPGNTSYLQDLAHYIAQRDH